MAAHAVGSVGARDDARALVGIGSLANPTNQLRVVRLLGRGILAADMTAVRETERVLADRTNGERVRIIAALGAHSSTAAQAVEASLAPVIVRASRQTHTAAALVEATRVIVGARHSERSFVYWVTNDPDGFSRFAWSAALHAAGARVWDRNWSRLVARADTTVRHRRAARAGSEHAEAATLDKAIEVARDAAIRSLVESALSDEASVRRRAWLNALEQAERMPGTVAWARYTQTVRAELGATAWTTTNNLIGDHVSVIINELPWIAGFVGMIALAAEAATASARSGAVRDQAQIISAYDDVDEALATAMAGSGGTLPRTA
ncbi:MAG TPA: hypothetical protein VFN21_06005 [Acidimicrobiales bacterium]|nr:hypothetical protein [Acidimicrobiales bacterium]